MTENIIPCPNVGHQQFRKTLKFIEIGSNVDTREQVTKFIRPYACTDDGELGIRYAQGELQKADYLQAMLMFAYPGFVERIFTQHQVLFRFSQCRIYQFQNIPRLGPTFVFGLFITDGSHNLIDYCVDSRQHLRRRQVLHKLIRAVCTPESVLKKIHH